MICPGTTDAKQSNIEKLAAYINSQPNPRAFASVLLAVAALIPATPTTKEQLEEA